MKLIVDYDELSKTGKFFDEKNKEIDNILNNIENVLNRLDTAWEGDDMKTFKDKYSSIIKEQREKRKEVEVLGQIVNIVSQNYSDKDSEWQEKIKKEHMINE
jgi:WXG100 family type VII secretion target